MLLFWQQTVKFRAGNHSFFRILRWNVGNMFSMKTPFLLLFSASNIIVLGTESKHW